MPLGTSPRRRAVRIRRRLEQYRSARRSSGHGLVEEFDGIRRLLEDMEYLEGWRLTERGQRLRGSTTIRPASDRGPGAGSVPRPGACRDRALTSVFVYEPRTDTASLAEWPTAALAERVGGPGAPVERPGRSGAALRLSPTRRPDPGFGIPAHEWASGADFDDLSNKGMAPGDFVRVSRQLVDLVRQLRDSAPGLREDARAALRAIDRGGGRRPGSGLVAQVACLCEPGSGSQRRWSLR